MAVVLLAGMLLALMVLLYPPPRPLLACVITNKQMRMNVLSRNEMRNWGVVFQGERAGSESEDGGGDGVAATKTVRVHVMNALDGNPVSGAEVTLVGPRGRGTLEGRTGGDGKATMGKMPPGAAVTVSAVRSGFIPYEPHQFRLGTGTVAQTLHFSMSPELKQGEIRVTLNWDRYPDDLDLQDWVTTKSGSPVCHVRYDQNKDMGHRHERDGEHSKCSRSGGLELELDIDSRDHESGLLWPETITIYTPAEDYVHLFYVRQYNRGRGNLVSSGAKVDVYASSGAGGGRRVGYFDVPATHDRPGIPRGGWGWQLFCLYGSTLENVTRLDRIVDRSAFNDAHWSDEYLKEQGPRHNPCL